MNLACNLLSYARNNENQDKLFHTRIRHLCKIGRLSVSVNIFKSLHYTWESDSFESFWQICSFFQNPLKRSRSFYFHNLWGFCKKMINRFKCITANKMWEQMRRLCFTENINYVFAIFTTDKESKITGCRWQGFGSRGGVWGEKWAEMPGTSLGRTQTVAATPSCFLLAPQEPHHRQNRAQEWRDKEKKIKISVLISPTTTR